MWKRSATCMCGRDSRIARTCEQNYTVSPYSHMCEHNYTINPYSHTCDNSHLGENKYKSARMSLIGPHV
jgi:hypothetical protein